MNVQLAGSVLMGAGLTLLFYSGGQYFARALDYVESDFREKMRRLRIPARNLRSYLISWLVLVGAVFLLFLLGLGSLIFGALGAAFLVCLPWYLIRRRAFFRQQKLEDQLADAMMTFASAVRAGLSMSQAMEILAEQTPRPLSEEFKQLVGEYQLGKPLEQVLVEGKERLRSENFALFAAALLASRESGGRLNETVERIAGSIHEMQRLERKVQSETAQARKSAVYMAVVPFFILGAYYFMDPEVTTRLFTTLPGQILVSLCLVLDVVAYFWALWLLNPDI